MRTKEQRQTRLRTKASKRLKRCWPQCRRMKRGRTVRIGRGQRSNPALLLEDPTFVDRPSRGTKGNENLWIELERHIDSALEKENERRQRTREEIKTEIDEIMLASLQSDNRNFIQILIAGQMYRALLDPGATLSLAGPKLAERFKDRMDETNTRVRTATGDVTRALGCLPICIEIDGRAERIVFKAIAELEQDFILGMDFCQLFDVDTSLGRGVWRAREGTWYPFDREEDKKDEQHILAECAGISTIGPSEREQVDALVEKILSRQTSEAGKTKFIKDRIRLKSNEPVRCRPTRMSKYIRDEAQRIIGEWKLCDIIKASTSDYSSAPVMVKKFDDTYRMCIDVNAKTIKDAYPASSLDSILDGLRGARCISKIDLKQAFLQVPMEESSKKYTAFAIERSRLWQFKRITSD